MEDLKTREDVFTLVSTFYDKVRKDELLGPIFNTSITNWPEHLDLLTDFWETNLFLVKKYNGNPLEKHVEVAKNFNHSINEKHFGVWLNLWFQTIDQLYVGEKAQLAKNRARNMGSFIHIKMFEARNTN